MNLAGGDEGMSRPFCDGAVRCLCVEDNGTSCDALRSRPDSVRDEDGGESTEPIS